MSILAAGLPDNIDPAWIGLLDAKMSGWYQNEVDELFRGFPISAQDYVIDVGCGDGISALFCAERGAHVSLVDIDADNVAEVSSKISAQGKARSHDDIVSDCNPLPIADSVASRVICQEVLEHVADPDQFLSELARVAAPGALFLLTVPGENSELIQKSFAPKSYYEYPNHIRIFSELNFKSLVENTGLEILEYTSCGFYLTFWASIHWAVRGETVRQQGGDFSAEHSPFASPIDDSLKDWATLWNRLIATPQGKALKQELDSLLPKNQIVIARKPH